MSPYTDRLRQCFDAMVVFKDLNKNSFVSSFKLPSFMRDFILRKFQDDEGNVDVREARNFIEKFLPDKNGWKAIQSRLISDGDRVRLLAKIEVFINIAKREFSFSLPDYGLQARDTVISQSVWDRCSKQLLQSDENWGVVELTYDFPDDDKQRGLIRLLDYRDFCPYEVDPQDFIDARRSFRLDEWIDLILGAVDYNAQGYDSREQKLAVLQRLLPFAEKRLNLMELAPAGTGKSYLFGQISRYGWLVSGNVTRAKLIYDMGRHQDGIVALRDFVALDEIREADYMHDTEIQSALQGIMENGKYRAADNHEVNVDAGIIFLGNIKSTAMNDSMPMLEELPTPFHQSQFLDRIHGFIKGWELPRVNEDMKVRGWALNSEFFSTVMHCLRDDPQYRATVDEMIEIPPRADTRDTEAVKRLCTAWLKLLFPDAGSPGRLEPHDFETYCLKPAVKMRSIIRRQMGFTDAKLAGREVPDYRVRGLS